MKPHSKPVCPDCGVCLMCVGEKKATHAADCPKKPREAAL